MLLKAKGHKHNHRAYCLSSSCAISKLWLVFFFFLSQHKWGFYVQGKRNVRFLFVLWYAPKHSLNTANISAVIFHIRAVLLQFFHYPEKEFSVSSARFSFFSLVFPHLFFFKIVFWMKWKHLLCHGQKGHFLHVYPSPDPVAMETHSLTGRGFVFLW